MKNFTQFAKVIVLAIAVLFIFSSASAQQILLDKPVRAGQLTLFPQLGNENIYYYLPDKVALAKHDDGTPQFSFLRYVENVRSTAETREGEGGGIVHAVVELKVTQEMLDEALTALRRIKSGAIIQGPIVYRGGTIALISSFKENNEFTKKVIGLGKAPLLDNERVAISILLTKLGAKILWESFKTPTPDMSISFEMEMAGFRSPIGATIEANFDQMYQHHAFQAAVATPILAGEIKLAFDDLVREGAIKVTQIGSDASIEKAVDAAYSKLLNMMFDPLNSSGTPTLDQLVALGSNNQPSMLDRATKMLNTPSTSTEVVNTSATADTGRNNRSGSATADTGRNNRSGSGGGNPQATGGGTPAAPGDGGGTPAVTDPAAPRNLVVTDSSNQTIAIKWQSNREADFLRYRIYRDTIPHPNTKVDSTTRGKTDTTKSFTGLTNGKRYYFRITAVDSTGNASGFSNEVNAVPGGTTPRGTTATNTPARPDSARTTTKTSTPSLAIAVSYEMKIVHQKGTFRIDLNKYNTDNLVMRFDGNFGRINCPECMREINLDDPLYLQREVTAFLDGANVSDFDKYINFVDVSMKKTHQGGALTFDEKRIDRKNFNSEGNNFKMVYGWKNDTNRTNWLDYDYKTEWSFFGGYKVASDWQTNNSGTIALSAPFIRRTISIEADPDLIKAANVRSIEVKVYTTLGTSQDVKELRLNTRNNQFAGQVDVMQTKGTLDFDYEVKWYLNDGTTKSSPKKTTNSTVLFVDTI